MFEHSAYQDVYIGHGSASLLGNAIQIYLYIVDGLLVDTGPSRLAADNSQFFSQHEIKQAVLTHVHEDHSGMAAWLQDKYKIPVYLHEDSLEYAQQSGKYPLYRRKIWGNRNPFRADAMPAQISTPHYVFDAIDAPGHSPAHNAFYEKNQGWLFTGDLYLGSKPLVAFKDEDMAQMIATLEKLTRLDFDTVFCAHSGVRPDGKRRLQEKLEYLLNLQGKVNELREQGLNDRRIDNILFPRKPPITYVSRGEWSSLNMVRTF
ncbi:MAG TPA: MBL fold metallo-hydrolase [Syntrophomonas sp.]|nr:MBL fold metallo-hydrolase [Syntrophomonas sp.]